MSKINEENHPGLYRYRQELRQYPELTEDQCRAVIADLKKPEGSSCYETAREKLICSHLRMVLAMADRTIVRYCGLSMEDFVGIGNLAMVEQFKNFNPDKGVPFSAYMKKVIVRNAYASIKSHVVGQREDGVEVDSIGIAHTPNRSYLAHRLESALSILPPHEQRIIKMLFDTDGKPNYAATARTLRRTERGLRSTLEDIFKKLRPLLSDLQHGKDKIYIEPRGDYNDH